MAISIDASTLLGFYQSRSGASGSSTSTSGGTAPGKAPTPPWSSKSSAAQQSTLTQAVLAGSRFIQPTAAKLDLSGANSDDYKNLFALYQGLTALKGVATAASAANLSEANLTQYQSRFKAGMTEVQSFLAAAPYKAFTVAQGQVAASTQTTVGVKREDDNFTTGALFTGTLADAVPAFQGDDTAFALSLTKPSGAATTVNFDFDELGSTPRTMSNVVLYLNSKLQAAGVFTRFANVRIPATPTTVTAGSSKVTIPAGQDSFALKLVGVSTETPSFTAASTAPGVFVASTSGRTAAQATDTLKADATLQIAKFDGSGDVDAEDDGTTKIFGRTLPSNVTAVRSTVTGPDGALYVLADVNGPTTDGQTIKGASDVALIKYDSAGDIAFTRTLGAASAANGYAIGISADGKSIAIAGTVAGTLDGAGGVASDAATDTFTSVFTSAGEESWTTRRTGSIGTQPTAVSFGPDGAVYVVGKTGGSVQGGTALGGGDGYLQAFTTKGVASYSTDIGSAQADKSAGVSADAAGVVVASVENGHAVLRRYDYGTDGKLAPGAVRDLGDLQGGDIAGLSRTEDGSLVLAGSTHNGALDAGAVTTAYDGGRELFVAKVSATLAPTSSDALSYVDLGADANTAALTVANGQVYVTGQLDQGDGKTLGYAAAVDPTTGALGWHDTLKGGDGLSAPSAIAVASNGASILDKLGLPTGAISYTGSQSLVANTSLRAGDQFTVRAGTGAAAAVTIAADDTLTTLAAKINRALGFKGKAEVVTVKGYDQLKITPLNSRTDITLSAGTAGKSALSSLGLTEALLQAAPTATSSSSSASSTTTAAAEKTYGLKLPTTLGIASVSAAKNTAVLISSAMTTLQLAYSDLAFPTVASSKTKGNTSGAVPAYLTNQISNYQLALARLGGSG